MTFKGLTILTFLGVAAAMLVISSSSIHKSKYHIQAAGIDLECENYTLYDRTIWCFDKARELKETATLPPGATWILTKRHK